MKFKKYCLGVLIWGLSINYVHAVQYSYDDLNRLKKAEYESGIIIEYEYDQAGNILKITTYDKQSGKPIEDIEPDEGEGNPGEDTKPDEGENSNGGQPDTGSDSGNNNGTGGGTTIPKDKIQDSDKQNQGTNSQTKNEEKLKPPKDQGTPSLVLKLNGATYILNGQEHPVDAKIFISKNDRLMVPVRYIAYALNISPDKIKWDGKGKTVTIEGNKTITISINQDYMLVDGTKVKLNEKAQLVNGRVFLPIADISRAFHINYTWDNTLKQLSLFNQDDSEIE